MSFIDYHEIPDKTSVLVFIKLLKVKFWTEVMVQSKKSFNYLSNLFGFKNVFKG